MYLANQVIFPHEYAINTLKWVSNNTSKSWKTNNNNIPDVNAYCIE